MKEIKKDDKKPLSQRMPGPQSDEELDYISPEARKMMEQKKKDIEQERRQKGMEESLRPKKMAKGGKVGSASKRADGCAMRGKTKGRMV